MCRLVKVYFKFYFHSRKKNVLLYFYLGVAMFFISWQCIFYIHFFIIHFTKSSFYEWSRFKFMGMNCLPIRIWASAVSVTLLGAPFFPPARSSVNLQSTGTVQTVVEISQATAYLILLFNLHRLLKKSYRYVFKCEFEVD